VNSHKPDSRASNALVLYLHVIVTLT